MTATQRLVESAARYGHRPALVPAHTAEPYSFAEMATTIRRAAAGLAWRGLRPRDVVGGEGPHAAAYVLARPAIRAAGGVPGPGRPPPSAAEAAGAPD